MKRKHTITLLLIGLLAFISCNEVKKAHHETFKSSEETQNELAELFNNPLAVSSPDKERENVKKTLLETYSQLLNVNFPELDGNQKEKTLEMIGRDIDEWRRTEISLLFQPQKLDEIQAELYEFLNTEEVLLYSSVFFVEDNRVRVTAINPKNEKEADWYWYETATGKWRKESPVKISKRDLERMDKKTLPLNSIKLSTAHLVFSEALKRLSEIEGAELPALLTYYHHPHNRYWSVYLIGSRADYTLEADIEGKITKFEMR